jgi:hypothetical protein
MSHSAAPKPLRQPRWRWPWWVAALAICAGVFTLYLRPGFLFTLADQLWACF